MAGHGIEAEEALADFQPRAVRLHHLGEAPDRDDAHPFLPRRKELPIAHRLAQGGIGDVVGGEGEAVDTQQRLPFAKIPGLQLVFTDAAFGNLVALDQQFQGGPHQRSPSAD
ncbi:hypothetical protein D3C76_1448100 [compost metagenome]